MILEAGEKDLLPVAIHLYDGNEPRALRYTAADGSTPAAYECLRFRCCLQTERAAEGEPNSLQNDGEGLGTFLYEAETEKGESGIGGGEAADAMRFWIPLKALHAVPGRYLFEVQLVTYYESVAGSAKSADTEAGAITVLFGDGENCLIVHGEVKG